MNNALSSFKPRRHVSVRAQITASLREMLLDGRLKEGDRLPSSQELASLWQAQEPTVHRALTPLVKEGLLERTPKVGTFVRRREERLTQIGIYAPGDLWRNSAYAFGRALCNELHEAMAGDGIAESIWVDPRPNAEQDQPWDELVRAAAERRFQVLIVPTVNLPKIAWLEKLAVPVVYLSSANVPNRVCLDGPQWAGAAMQILAQQGCRRVGAICAMRLPDDEGNEDAHEFRRFYSALEKESSRLGLELRPEWIFRPGGVFTNPGVEMQMFGFDSMRALWGQAERPDGIAVFEDVTATGVLMAIMREHIRVPDELKLVLHRNAEVGLFSPVPAAFLDIRIKEVAAALMTQARRLYDGDEIEAIHVAHHPVPQHSQSLTIKTKRKAPMNKPTRTASTQPANKIRIPKPSTRSSVLHCLLAFLLIAWVVPARGATLLSDRFENGNDALNDQWFRTRESVKVKDGALPLPNWQSLVEYFPGGSHALEIGETISVTVAVTLGEDSPQDAGRWLALGLYNSRGTRFKTGDEPGDFGSAEGNPITDDDAGCFATYTVFGRQGFKQTIKRESGASAPVLGGSDRIDCAAATTEFDDFVVGTPSTVELRITRTDAGLFLESLKDGLLLVSGKFNKPQEEAFTFDTVYIRNNGIVSQILVDNITVETKKN